jgi:hypothetical protein
MDGKHRLERWALVGLFLLAFLLRAVYPVSRPLQWYFRSAEFFEAILHGDWAGTLFSEHPGVTVMWLSGAALWGWYGLQSLLGLNPPAPLKTEGYAFADRVAAGVLPLALIVALGIVWGWFLLRRLFGRRVAWTAALLWALDPFYLANSKALHLDATLSTLMVLSALWMLIYVRERRRRQLALSAILGGLAILTKVSAVFLIPFLGLCLLVDWLPSLRNPRVALTSLRSLISNLLLWVLIAATVCFVLWPSLWVQPGASLDRVIRQGVLLHTGGPRDQPLFYRGELGVHDPGPRFYLDTILHRTTFVTLPFSLIGLLAAGLLEREERLSSLLLVGFALFYFVQMSLGGWKDGRYVLPILLAIDVLAGLGLLWWADRIRGRMLPSPSILIGLLLAAQAFVIIRHHPYYGTHYNTLLGGSQAASRTFPLAEFGEGLDQAGQYVDTQPGAEHLVVGTQFLANEMLAQHVRAPVYDIAQVEENVDYLVFGVQYTTRGPEYPRWGALWEQTYKFREPQFVASFGGAAYSWVHRPGAEPEIPRRTDASLGEHLRLEGYRLAQATVSPGDRLLLTLYWRAEEPIEEDYTVFVHLQKADGGLAAQQDNPPVRGTRPTDGWVPGELIEDPYEIEIPFDATSGEYVLGTGMYDSATIERLVAFGPGGERLSEGRVVLERIHVRPAVSWWQWVIPGAWVAIIVVGVVRSRFHKRTVPDGS